MAAGADRDRLLGAMAALIAELGGATGADDPTATDGGWSGGEATAGILSEDEEALVGELGECLARLASASAVRGAGKQVPASAVEGAIGGAQILMRGELIAGRDQRLAGLLPGFAYMVTLPHLGQGEALALSRRAAELLGIPPSAS